MVALLLESLWSRGWSASARLLATGRLGAPRSLVGETLGSGEQSEKEKKEWDSRFGGGNSGPLGMEVEIWRGMENRGRFRGPAFCMKPPNFEVKAPTGVALTNCKK
jgi:hypothetical protein